jgi:DNA-binding transcriptional regulator YiaG
MTTNDASGEGSLGQPPPTDGGEIEIAGRRYVTPQRLSIILNVSVRTLARWNASRIGPPKITIGKKILFDVAKLPDWLATREIHAVRNARH